MIGAELRRIEELLPDGAATLRVPVMGQGEKFLPLPLRDNRLRHAAVPGELGLAHHGRQAFTPAFTVHRSRVFGPWR